MDFKRRLTGLQAKMEEQGLDLVVYGGSPDLQYLTGANLEWRRGRDLLHPQDNVFVPRQGEPILTINNENHGQTQGTWIKDVRYAETAQPYGDLIKKIIMDLGVKTGRIAIGDFCWGSTSLEIAKACAGSRFRVGEGLLDQIRMIKEPEEVAKLKKSAEVTESVMTLIYPRIVEGLTQKNLQIMMEMMGRGLGATDTSFPPTGGYLKTGTIPSDDPFIYPKEAGLTKGTSIAFDFGLVVDGYCSDWGRSLYYGQPRSDILQAYQALQLAVVQAGDVVGSEITHLCDFYPYIEKALDKQGYGNFLRNRLKTGIIGHQIGVEVHEDPWLKPDATQLLVEGMVFCLEPKLWSKGEYYLRVEDMILISNGKAEFLTTSSRDHFQV
ncbi:MAG: Xaa-Pro peptidase family protein [Candidatus Bathyarchaeia archaeon]|jgi:Xaa-Pro aminopeptidase